MKRRIPKYYRRYSVEERQLSRRAKELRKQLRKCSIYASLEILNELNIINQKTGNKLFHNQNGMQKIIRQRAGVA